jgi:hypothetical protein
MSLGDLNAPESGRGVYVLKQSANIYTMLLILSFIFVLIGCLFLFLEMKAYDLTIKVPPDDKAPQVFWSPNDVQGTRYASFDVGSLKRRTGLRVKKSKSPSTL